MKAPFVDHPPAKIALSIEVDNDDPIPPELILDLTRVLERHGYEVVVVEPPHGD